MGGLMAGPRIDGGTPAGTRRGARGHQAASPAGAELVGSPVPIKQSTNWEKVAKGITLLYTND